MISQAILLLQLLPFTSDPGVGGEGPDAVRNDSSLASWQDPNEFRVFWKDSLRMETRDGMAKIRIGGRFHQDYSYVKNNPRVAAAVGTSQLEDGVNFRRARVYLRGELWDSLEFKTQYDFAGGMAEFKDVYIGTTGNPVNFRVGQFKEPFSLEELTSSNNITFMERSLANAFTPGRSTGIMAHGTASDDNLTFAVGIFRDSDDQGDQMSDAEWSATGRITGTPIYKDEEGDYQVLHLGLSLGVHSPDQGMYRVRARPEMGFGPRFVNTGNFAVEDVTLVGLEAAWVNNRYSVQGEYIQSDANAVAGPDPSFSGYYVEGGFFLTEDHRNYKRSKGAFSGVKPGSNAFIDDDEGCGALEAKLRYSSIDLNDGPILGGELTDIGAGLNWYTSNNTRVMFEVIQADLDGVDDTLIGQIRIQFAF
ncbi:MAG: hypothetical protein DWQ01_19915 [Planctomycetota bacterium]|nr:MAG: hypothetical protein DWQ01_19915 [Planctomycetota bacterium]